MVLVEDDAEVARTTRRVLTGLHDVIVDACHDTASARRAMTQPFDVIVSDYHLPDGTGVEVLAAAARANIDAPRIMITAHTDWECAALAVNFGGAFRVLGKPLEPEVLTAAVAEALVTKTRRDAETRKLANERLTACLSSLEDREQVLRALCRAIDRRLGPSVARADVMANVGRALAECLGLEVGVVAAIEQAILAHRIGTVGLRDDASAALVPLIGAEILSAAGFPLEISQAVAESGEQVVPCVWTESSVPARILAISARYVHLVQQDCAVHEAACEALLADDSLDPVLVAAFVTQPESTWSLAPEETSRGRPA